MKTFFRKHLIWVSAILCMGIIDLSVSSCKKKSDPPAPATQTTTDTNTVYNGSAGVLSLHLHTYIDEAEVDEYTYVYTTTEGRKISLDLAQLYLYKITLIKQDGSTFTVPDTILLKDLSHDLYPVGKVPAGKYKSIKFNVGLPPATNALAASAKKVLNHSEMWFGAAAQPDGYVFAHIKGRVDTTTAMTAKDNTEMTPFKYLIGTNANLLTVVMPVQSYTIVQDLPYTLHLNADFSQIFNGIQLNNSQNLTLVTVADNSTPLGLKLRNNLAAIFKYENQ